MMLLVATTGLHPTRCVAPRMQQPARQIAVRELQSQADLRVALQETPAMGISLLMLSAPDCAKAAKVKKFLLDRGTPNPLVQHLSLEFMPDDTDNWLAFRGTNPARTPHCIAYDTEAVYEWMLNQRLKSGWRQRGSRCNPAPRGQAIPCCMFTLAWRVYT